MTTPIPTLLVTAPWPRVYHAVTTLLSRRDHAVTTP